MDGIELLLNECEAAILAANDTPTLRAIELQFLGKSGSMSSLMRTVGSLPPEDRPLFGSRLNAAKARAEGLLDEKRSALLHVERASQFDREQLDVTLPGHLTSAGMEHVLQQTTNEIKNVLGGMGFVYMESPELEEFRYNFGALNYPPDHPAMDAQDTFFVSADRVMRTQCTALQGRVYESMKPPLRVFTVGRCFRNEAVDRTHGHTFHQVDAFMIDEGISMAHLKGTLSAFTRAIFGDEVTVRFRPDFFPFVEPGVDYAISTPKLFNGRWVELGGAGMIHPDILERYGIDKEKYSGFAFGLGVERIPMMKYGIDDLRLFMENDLRFLSRFA